MPDTLASKIAKDLEKSGFGSEMRAIQSFNDRNWHCNGNFSYFDKDEEITREGDFHAGYQCFQQFPNKEHVETWFYIVGEVKKSEKPWVVFKKDISGKENWNKRVEGWRNMIFAVDLPCHPKEFANAISAFTIRSEQDWIGYGVHESFKDPHQPSRWYSALISLCKASEHVLDTNSWETEDMNKVAKDIVNTSTHLFMVKPVLVLDAPLFSAVLDASNQIHVESVKFATLEFEFSTRKYNRNTYIIDIVTLENLSEYIELAERRHKKIFDEILAKRLLAMP